MPTYEYECRDCGERLDIFQRISDEPLEHCPKCDSAHGLVRLIGKGGGIIFKGSGFYETDYRSSEYKNRLKKDKESVSKKEDSPKKEESTKKSDKKDVPVTASKTTE